MPIRNSAFPPGLVIYQVYPRSFQDTTGNGIGDLAGIIKRLDYLAWLGITAIWLNPFYRSPMVDFGYDITDHQSVDPLFGDLATFDQLVAAAHQRGIKIIIDLVVNHTSDQHPWFQGAQTSATDPYHDWYVWGAGKGAGKPPNNWLSVFGGSAWQWDDNTKEYYLHSFSPYQPDLNWSNPTVRRAVKDIITFWLERGVDGLRLDAVYWYAKDQALRDDPTNPHFQADRDSQYDSLRHSYSRNQPELADYLEELSEVLEEYEDRFMVTEAYVDPPTDEGEYLSLYHEMDPKVGAPFNFTGLDIPWQAPAFKHFIDSFQAGLQPPDVPVYVLGNHDRPRLASRFGQAASRTAALLLLTLPGVAVMYYGDELGMTDVPIPPEAMQDKVQADSKGMVVSRDPARTPMPWSTETNAGFSTAKPWLPLGDYQHLNVASQQQDSASLLNLYHQLLDLRRQSVTLRHGTYEPLDLKHTDLFGFVRQYGRERLVMVINFSTSRSITYSLGDHEVLLSTALAPSADSTLQAGEGRLLRLR